MTICIYCNREAIRVSSFTTGCCREARKVWALEQVNKNDQSISVEPYDDDLSSIRQTLLDVRAPKELEGITSIHRQIRLLARERDEAQKMIRNVENAIDFATNGCPDSLPDRIAGMCSTIRSVIAQRDELRNQLEKNPKAERLLEMLKLLANSSREGWEKVCALHEHFGSKNDEVFTILHHAHNRPPGWHGG